jgi:diguanylate cyclase (GGDEF)-like protein
MPAECDAKKRQTRIFMSHSNKLRTIVGLTAKDTLTISAFRDTLLEILGSQADAYRQWFRDKLQWPDEAGDPLLPGTLESYIDSDHDARFCMLQYKQALHWHQGGLNAEHALAAQSHLRQILMSNDSICRKRDLMRSLCRVVDLAQAVQAMVFHVVITLERLAHTAEHELHRIRQDSDDILSVRSSDLLRAYSEHLAWNMKAYALALGESPAGVELEISPHKCAVGRWLANGGLHVIPEEERSGFTATHERLHRLAAEILEQAHAGNPFNIVDYLMDMEAASDQLVAVMAHAIDLELRQLAAEDSLTHLGNRRLFERDMERHLAQARRNGSGLGLLFLDVDHFKQVNDRYGHDVGDEVLRSTAGRLVELLRSADSVYRWGGEEFTFLGCASGQQELEKVAERLRRGFEQTPVYTSDGLLDLTVSVGGVFCQPHDTEVSSHDLFRVADANMHVAKKQGRNRVMVTEFPAGQ